MLRAANALTIDAGARIEARGGFANRSVPFAGGPLALPLYEGNVREVSSSERPFGGLGGDGSPGRVRVEAPEGSGLLLGEPGETDLITGRTLFAPVESVAVSKPFRLGFGPGGAVFTHDLEIISQTVRPFDSPTGTEAVALWQGAGESLDALGAIAEFDFGVRDIDDLPVRDYLRFEIVLISNGATGEVPAVDRVEVRYRMR